MYNISRKNYLAQNLTKMKKVYPEFYNYFPETWLLPTEAPDLLNKFN
jgi:tubulin polyglutamylase TTLL6/13